MKRNSNTKHNEIRTDSASTVNSGGFSASLGVRACAMVDIGAGAVDAHIGGAGDAACADAASVEAGGSGTVADVLGKAGIRIREPTIGWRRTPRENGSIFTEAARDMIRGHVHVQGVTALQHREW